MAKHKFIVELTFEGDLEDATDCTTEMVTDGLFEDAVEDYNIEHEAKLKLSRVKARRVRDADEDDDNDEDENDEEQE